VANGTPAVPVYATCRSSCDPTAAHRSPLVQKKALPPPIQHPMTGPSMDRFRKDEVLRQSHGRAPWYDMHGVPIDAYVIGIAGGSASGKVGNDVALGR
jgi:hypothetical protein